MLFLCFFLLSSHSFPDWLSFTRHAFVSASFRLTSPPTFCAFHPRLFYSFSFCPPHLLCPSFWRRNPSARHLLLYTVNTSWTHIAVAGSLISQGTVGNSQYQWFSNYRFNNEISPCVACDVTEDNDLLQPQKSVGCTLRGELVFLLKVYIQYRPKDWTNLMRFLFVCYLFICYLFIYF